MGQPIYLSGYEFQSLIGKIKTMMKDEQLRKDYLFQSLIGKIQTMISLPNLFFVANFNPSQVRSKRSSRVFHFKGIKFQSLIGKIKTNETAGSLGQRLFHFNPSQVRSKRHTNETIRIRGLGFQSLIGKIKTHREDAKSGYDG